MRAQEVNKTSQYLGGQISTEQALIFYISGLCVCIVIAIVLYVAYRVSDTIALPLQRLIEVANFLNNNASETDALANLSMEFENTGEGEIAELVDAFQKLLRDLDRKNRSKGIKTKGFDVHYHRNQYCKADRVSMGAGESDVNWQGVLEDIVDEEPTMKTQQSLKPKKTYG